MAHFNVLFVTWMSKKEVQPVADRTARQTVTSTQNSFVENLQLLISKFFKQNSTSPAKKILSSISFATLS